MKIKESLNSNILKEFLNDTYLDYDNLAEISKVFSKNAPNSIKLEDFFKKEKYILLNNEIRNLKFKKKYIPDKLSFSISETGANFDKLFNSDEFRIFLEFIINKKITNFKKKALLIKHKDYSLLSDDNVKFTGILINFFFNDLWRDVYGGYFSYISENEEVLRILPSENSLTIVSVDEKVDGFIKYVNINSRKKRIYLNNAIIL